MLSSKTHRPQLGASRPRSLWFRLNFVFTVVHWFPVVVSQYYNPAALTFGPSQIRTCRVTASGSQLSLVIRTHPLCDMRSGRSNVWAGQRMLLREGIELVPIHITVLAPAAKVTLGHPASLAAVGHQQRHCGASRRSDGTPSFGEYPSGA